MHSKFLKLDQEKQTRIINAALKEFARKGYEHASTNEIVKEAGISKGLLFHYFKNKKDLFLFLYDYVSKVFLEEYLELTNLEERDVLERWHQHSLLKIDLIHKYPDMFHFIVTANQKLSGEIEQEIDHKNGPILSIGYEKLFGNIDESKFKDDIDIKRALNLIKWTMEGFTDEEKQKVKVAELNDDYYDRMLANLDSYFELLKKCLYKEG